MTPEILQLRERLIDARRNLVELTDLAAPIHDELDARIKILTQLHRDANAELLNALDQAALEVINADGDLREATVSTYKRIKGEKQLAPGVSVRVSTQLKYDEAAAVEWAEKNAPILILKVIDKKSFESLPAAPKLEFVESEEIVTAVISKNLAEAK
jgi:hypothetical protein